MDKLTISSMTEKDIEAVAALEALCFDDPWSAPLFADELKNEKAHYFVLRDENAVIGYGGFWKILDEGHIMNIAIHPEARARGLGSSLLSEMLACPEAEDIALWFLEVRVSNKNAIGLYEKFGFSGYHVRKGYYQNNGEDALLMMKTTERS